MVYVEPSATPARPRFYSTTAHRPDVSKLIIKQIALSKSDPNHCLLAHTNDLIECFNQTLNSMLRRVVDEKECNLDAIWKTPQVASPRQFLRSAVNPDWWSSPRNFLQQWRWPVQEQTQDDGHQPHEDDPVSSEIHKYSTKPFENMDRTFAALFTNCPTTHW